MTGLSIKGMMRLVYLGRSINFICTVYLVQKYTKFHVYRINNCFCCEVSCIPYCFKTFLASLWVCMLHQQFPLEIRLEVTNNQLSVTVKNQKRGEAALASRLLGALRRLDTELKALLPVTDNALEGYYEYFQVKGPVRFQRQIAWFKDLVYADMQNGKCVQCAVM